MYYYYYNMSFTGRKPKRNFRPTMATMISKHRRQQRGQRGNFFRSRRACFGFGLYFHVSFPFARLPCNHIYGYDFAIVTIACFKSVPWFISGIHFRGGSPGWRSLRWLAITDRARDTRYLIESIPKPVGLMAYINREIRTINCCRFFFLQFVDLFHLRFHIVTVVSGNSFDFKCRYS